MVPAMMVKRGLLALEDIRRLSAELHSSVAVALSTEFFSQKSSVYKPLHFEAYEVLPPEIYDEWGERGLCFIDNRMLWTADTLWEYFNQDHFIEQYPPADVKRSRRVYCNTWKWGGSNRYAGFNPPWVKRAAKLSQHFMGRALDFTFEGLPSEIIRAIIKQKRDKEPAFQYITTIEDDVNWLHFDCRNTLQDELLIVKP